MTNLLFVCGSLRAASSSLATSKTLAELLQDEADCSHADIGSIPHYNADLSPAPPAAEAFRDAVAAAGLVVFVTPEYNYSLPGVLKNAIDWASRPAMKSVFKDKRCLVISVSGGALGGVRAQSHLKYVLNGMLAEVVRAPEIVLPKANAKVTDGRIEDAAFVEFAANAIRACL